MTARYPVSTRLLHWLTVALLTAQFAIGYLMDDESGHGRGRGRGRGGESGPWFTVPGVVEETTGVP